MITVCNLFPPFGKILSSLGPFIIAEGSLIRGLERAVTMAGLVMFSRLVITPAMPLPGKIGRLLQESFVILELLNSTLPGKDNIKNGKQKWNILQNIDRRLCEISGG
jgi:hypothetical protein